MNKPFLVLLVIAVVIGAGLGGAFAGGVALGRSSDGGALTPLAGGPAAGFQAGGQAGTGQIGPGRLGQGGPGQPGAGRFGAGGQLQPGQQQQFGPDAAGSAESSTPNEGSQAFPFPRRGGVSGTVESIEGDILTITTADGPVKVSLSNETTVTQVSQANVDDLETGVQVTVMGPAGEDGSVTAANIVITPEGASGFPGGERSGERRFPGGGNGP